MLKKRHNKPILNQSKNIIFSQVWGQIKNTKSFLENNLPMSVLSTLDLNSLSKESDTFLNVLDKKNYSDILYKTQLKNEGYCYIYLLFEHENDKEKLTSLQVLTYMVRIWGKYKTKIHKKLIPIIPIVLHYGCNSLLWEPNFSSQFNSPNELERYIPHFQFKLCDLSSIFASTFHYY